MGHDVLSAPFNLLAVPPDEGNDVVDWEWLIGTPVDPVHGTVEDFMVVQIHGEQMRGSLLAADNDDIAFHAEWARCLSSSAPPEDDYEGDCRHQLECGADVHVVLQGRVGADRRPKMDPLGWKSISLGWTGGPPWIEIVASVNIDDPAGRHEAEPWWEKYVSLNAHDSFSIDSALLSGQAG